MPSLLILQGIIRFDFLTSYVKMSKLEYTKPVAFINREKELGFLSNYLDEKPEGILFADSNVFCSC